MLKRLIVISLVLSTAFLVVLGDKPEASNKKNADLKTAETKNKNAHIVLSKSSDKKTSETKVDKAEDRVDKISEKADTSSSYQTAGAPVAQGNLYYYYYPVAAYPVHADSAYDKVGSSGGGGGSLLGGIDTPLLFLLVPLVLLLAAVPLIGKTSHLTIFPFMVNICLFSFQHWQLAIRTSVDGLLEAAEPLIWMKSLVLGMNCRLKSIASFQNT